MAPLSRTSDLCDTRSTVGITDACKSKVPVAGLLPNVLDSTLDRHRGARGVHPQQCCVIQQPSVRRTCCGECTCGRGLSCCKKLSLLLPCLFGKCRKTQAHRNGLCRCKGSTARRWCKRRCCGTGGNCCCRYICGLSLQLVVMQGSSVIAQGLQIAQILKLITIPGF